MLSFLKDHPFAVEAFFESSLVLTFAIPKNQIQHLIPECLELDTFNNKWAFIAVAMVQTKGLRPGQSIQRKTASTPFGFQAEHHFSTGQRLLEIRGKNDENVQWGALR